MIAVKEGRSGDLGPAENLRCLKPTDRKSNPNAKGNEVVLRRPQVPAPDRPPRSR
jgi:hypothetical protein